MKFPGTYYAYAGLMAVFGQSAAGIHLGLILVTSLSILLLFLISRKVLNEAGGFMAAALFAALSAHPYANGLAGHATHFVVLFACLATYALLRQAEKDSTVWKLLAGASLGLAILMKQHAAVFALAGTLWLAWEKRSHLRPLLASLGILGGGMAAPIGLVFAGLAWAGVWQRFHFWTIEYARQYVFIFPLRLAPEYFVAGFGPIFTDGIWVWPLGLAGLALLFLRTPFRRAARLGAGLLLAGLLATIPGFYFRGHYFLMVMPGMALLNAALILALGGWVKKFPDRRWLRFVAPCLFVVVLADLGLRNARLWFALPPAEASRLLYHYNPFPESPAIADYLARHTTPSDTIAVLGSEPQLYFLAGRRPATGYIYMYPLTEPQALAARMRAEFTQEIEQARPKYVVHINIFASWCSAVIPGVTGPIIDRLENWWESYATNYQLVGMVDMTDGQPTRFFWDEQLANRTNTNPANIAIFVRK
jgi:hypothetical protein